MGQERRTRHITANLLSYATLAQKVYDLAENVSNPHGPSICLIELITVSSEITSEACKLYFKAPDHYKPLLGVLDEPINQILFFSDPSHEHWNQRLVA